MADYPRIDRRIIEFPFNTLKIICHAANIPEEFRPHIQTTKLIIPGYGPETYHPGCHTGDSIDCILTTRDQIFEIVQSSEHNGLCDFVERDYWCQFRGKDTGSKVLHLGIRRSQKWGNQRIFWGKLRGRSTRSGRGKSDGIERRLRG